MVDGRNLSDLERELQEETQLIQQKAERLNQLRLQEQDRVKQAKLTELDQVVSDAKAFRLEAANASTESERTTLRGYAVECENRAATLRIELGLQDEEQPIEIDYNAGHRAWLSKQIKGNTSLSILFLTVWFALYYVGEGSQGTIGYIAQVLSKPAFHAFLLFAGLLFVFLVVQRYFYVVTEYLNAKANGASFALDFQESKPIARLFFVLGLLYVITQFLASIYQVTL